MKFEITHKVEIADMKLQADPGRAATSPARCEDPSGNRLIVRHSCADVQTPPRGGKGRGKPGIQHMSANPERRLRQSLETCGFVRQKPRDVSVVQRVHDKRF